MAPTGHRVRDAKAADAAACAEIYSPYVTESTITFETEPPTADEMAARIGAAARTHAWLVLEQDQRVIGYAYAAPFKTRAAYRWSCEVSLYLEFGRRRAGGGRELYGALLDAFGRARLPGCRRGRDGAERGQRRLP